MSRIQEAGTPVYTGWMQPAYYDPANTASAALPHSPSYGHMHPFYTGPFIRIHLKQSNQLVVYDRGGGFYQDSIRILSGFYQDSTRIQSEFY